MAGGPVPPPTTPLSVGILDHACPKRQIFRPAVRVLGRRRGRSSDPQFECSVDRAAALAGRRLAVRGMPQSATLAVMAGAMNSLWCLQMALVGGPLVGQPQFEQQ